MHGGGAPGLTAPSILIRILLTYLLLTNIPAARLVASVADPATVANGRLHRKKGSRFVPQSKLSSTLKPMIAKATAANAR